MSINVIHQRESQDIRVRLFWNSDTNHVYVLVRNRHTRDCFVVAPDPTDALDAFYHPFCYGGAQESEAPLCISPGG